MGNWAYIPNGSNISREMAQALLAEGGDSLASRATQPLPEGWEGLVDIIERATRQVCKISFETTAEKKESMLIGCEPTFLGSITACMKLAGDISGWVSISLEEPLARRLTARLAWCKPEEVAPEDLPDGVGEIINQISGLAKTLLSQDGREMDIGLPECYSERQTVPGRNDQPSLTMIYECLGSRFAIQLSVEVRQPVSTGVPTVASDH